MDNQMMREGATAAAPETDARAPGLVRFRFFRDLSPGQRLAVFKAFGLLPAEHDERLSHSAEARLLESILAPATSAAALPDADLAGKLNAAVDAEYPAPDSPHTSVKMQWVDNRAAMWRGINATLKIFGRRAPAQRAAGQEGGA